MFLIILAIVYRKSIEETFNGFVDGIKSFIAPAIAVILACSVFVFIYYNPVISPVTSLLLEATNEFNVALSSIYTIINSVFYVDYYYLSYSVLYPMISIYTDTSVLSIISVMFTNLYSLVMLIAPTSIFLIAGLSYLQIPYKEWVKYIYKYFLIVFGIVIVVSVIANMML